MVSRTISSLAWLLFVFVEKCIAHSWIACTDYQEMSGLYYSHDKCRAWPRSGHMYAPRSQPFGYESGYAFVPRIGTPCRTNRNDICGYNAQHPMAKYYRGQKVVIAHPAKNHCNDPTCGQKNNQDNGNYVYAFPTTITATSDPLRDEIIKPSNLIADLGISPVDGRAGYNYSDFVTYPKVGFQNAPAYCQGPDSALATNNITIPANWVPGRYTFMWVWFMGSIEVTSAYSSCWEADVYLTKADADAARAAAYPPARQDVRVGFNNYWGSGADGYIDMTADYNNTFVIVSFPTAVASFSVWGALVNSTNEQKARGEYILYQRGMSWIPSQAGFTVTFSQESYLQPCGVNATQIQTIIGSYYPTQLVGKSRRPKKAGSNKKRLFRPSAGMNFQFGRWGGK